MIETTEGSFFVVSSSNFFRLHGSAALRAVLPASVSTAILLLAVAISGSSIEENNENRWLAHPYVIQVSIVATTFLLAYRANFAYGRYWEGATVVHQMLSKWLDVGTLMTSFHYQSKRHDRDRPASFGDHPEVKDGTRERQRFNVFTHSEYIEHLPPEPESKRKSRRFLRRLFRKRKRPQEQQHQEEHQEDAQESSAEVSSTSPQVPESTTSMLPEYDVPTIHTTPSTRVSGLDEHEHTLESSSLFLQELVHLLSLLSAVAMATLRNDIEGTESPLIRYVPGAPWPPVDPDNLGEAVRYQYHEESRFWTCVYFILGLDRSPRHTTLYNAARPFGVLGGVSDAEIEQLQDTRGPYAKVGLCTMWLQEYMTREHLNGAVGDIHPALMSRLYQFTSDGMIGYNQSRKIAYIPFPFPHEQGTIFVLCVLVFLFPVLYFSFVNRLAMACIMNFITVMSFVGLHEVARELENPFWNTPNDLPLTTFQAQFNEALLTACFGFHPDFYWKEPLHDEMEEEKKLLGELEEEKEEENTLLPEVQRKESEELPGLHEIKDDEGVLL